MTDTASNAPKSPDSLQLRKKPIVGPRLGKRGAAIAVGVAVLLIGVLVWNTESRKRQNEAKPQQAAAEQDARLRADLSAAEAFTRGATNALPDFTPAVDDLAATQEPTAKGPTSSAPPSGYTVPDLSAGSVDLGESEFERQQRQQQEARQLQLAQEREARARQAREAATAVNSWQIEDSTPSPAAGPPMPAAAAAAGPSMAEMAALAQLGAAPGQQQKSDQEAKREFVEATQQLAPPILAAARQPARSPYELKTGHVIRAVTLRGINSDLPGEVTAMVTDNVYDSATGRHLLIPSWTKLFGVYNSEVAYGQERAQIAWTRLVFPDGSTLELGGMPGADMAGFTGFRDEVDNHYGRLIGFSLLSSVMAAGFQLSQPDSTAPQGQLSNQQVVAGEVGREMTQLGLEVTRRNLNVQPTIRVRPGYKFTVTVNRDIAFAGPYVTP